MVLQGSIAHEHQCGMLAGNIDRSWLQLGKSSYKDRHRGDIACGQSSRLVGTKAVAMQVGQGLKHSGQMGLELAIRMAIALTELQDAYVLWTDGRRCDQEEVAHRHEHAAAVAALAALQRAAHAVEVATDNFHLVALIKVNRTDGVTGQLVGMSAGNGLEDVHLTVGNGHEAADVLVTIGMRQEPQRGYGRLDLEHTGIGVTDKDVVAQQLLAPHGGLAKDRRLLNARGQEIINRFLTMRLPQAGQGAETILQFLDAGRSAKYVPLPDF